MSTIAPSILDQYVRPLAVVAEAELAATPAEFIDQLGVAAERLEQARINGAGDLENAAIYLTDASASEGADRKVLLGRAVSYLADLRDIADEYRSMIGD